MQLIDFIECRLKEREVENLTCISRFYLPLPLIKAAEEVLRRRGLQRREEMVLMAGWLGKQRGLVSTLIVPETISTTAEVRIPQEEILKIAETVSRRRLRVFLQAHTHPTDWTGLSLIDIQHPFSFSPGFIQIVVPWFCETGLFTPKTGVHETLGISSSGLLRTRRLSKAEICKRFWAFEPRELEEVIRGCPVGFPIVPD